jgi:hypothetical protein
MATFGSIIVILTRHEEDQGRCSTGIRCEVWIWGRSGLRQLSRTKGATLLHRQTDPSDAALVAFRGFSTRLLGTRRRRETLWLPPMRGQPIDHTDALNARCRFWRVASRQEQRAALNHPSQPLGRALMHDVPPTGVIRPRRQHASQRLREARRVPCDHPP